MIVHSHFSFHHDSSTFTNATHDPYHFPKINETWNNNRRKIDLPYRSIPRAPRDRGAPAPLRAELEGVVGSAMSCLCFATRNYQQRAGTAFPWRTAASRARH